MKFTAQEEYGLRCVLHLARLSEQAARTAGKGRREARGGACGSEAEERGAGSRPSQSEAGETGAGQPEPDCLSVSEVAEREGLSEQYAGKLIRILGKAGLVESVRGRNGGYRLSRPAEEIDVAQTLAALGGKIYDPGTCNRFRGNKRFCVHTNDCSIRSLWSGLQFLVDQVLSRVTLRDLVASEKTMDQWIQPHVETLATFEARIRRPRAETPESPTRDGGCGMPARSDAGVAESRTATSAERAH